MWTSEEPVELHIIRKVLTRAIQKCKLYQILAILSKVVHVGNLNEILAFLPQTLTKYG